MTFQRGDVREILRSCCGALVTNEIVARHHEYLLASVFTNNAIRPRCVECQAIDGGNEVDSHWLDADLKRDARRRKIVFRHGVHRSTERVQCPDDPGCVFTIRPHPDAEIFRRPNVTMCRESVRAPDEEFNAVSVQLDKQISEVLVRRHDSTLTRCG
jgi:hypothetical protein